MAKKLKLKRMHERCSKNTHACRNITDRFAEKNPCCIGHMEDLLVDVCSEMNKHDIDYWVDFGTLLGLIRDGGIIPWDTDVDICIMESDKPKLELIKPHLDSKGYLWDGYTGFGQRPGSFGITRINTSNINLNNVDIYYWNNHDGVMKGVCFREGQFEFPEGLIFEMDTITFKGVDIKIPKQYDEILTNRYGDWKTPKKMGYH